MTSITATDSVSAEISAGLQEILPRNIKIPLPAIVSVSMVCEEG